jgi:hypothetical protein
MRSAEHPSCLLTPLGSRHTSPPAPPPPTIQLWPPSRGPSSSALATLRRSCPHNYRWRCHLARSTGCHPHTFALGRARSMPRRGLVIPSTGRDCEFRSSSCFTCRGEVVPRGSAPCGLEGLLDHVSAHVLGSAASARVPGPVPVCLPCCSLC